MKKRTINGFLLLFLILTAGIIFYSSRSAAENENLLYNGDFEMLDEEGMPEGWFTDAWRMEPGYSVFSVSEGMDGGNAVSVQNIALNDARFAQTVQVEPEKMYCLSGYVLADGITEGHGANLSIEDVYAFSEEIFDTGGEWKKIEYYGETGPDQYEITILVRVGGYSGESKGRALFDHLSLTETSETPAGIVADLWYKPDQYAWKDEEEENSEISENNTGSPAWPLLIAIGIIYILVFAAVIYYQRDGKRKTAGLDSSEKFRIGPIFLLALGLRFILCFFIEGYSVDVNCFLSWGNTMVRNGPAGFYQATSFCDYPPLYMYAAGLSSWIAGITGADAGWTRIIFRMIPCVCDVAACMLILRYSEKYQKKDLYTRLVLLLLAFNPVTIVNSAAWGQMDSVVCLLLLGTAAFAIEKKWVPAILFYVTAVLVKPQALMLGFLGLAFMVLSVIRDRKELKKIAVGFAAGIVMMVAFILPFGIRQQPGWLISKYAETLSSYPYATLNTANLYYLAGGNWKPVELTAHFSVPAFFAAVCMLHGILWAIRNRSRKYYLTETAMSGLFAVWFALCGILQLNWTCVGIGAMAYAFVIVISMAVRHADLHFLPYLGALLFILLYVFGIKMHERYLMPAFILLSFAWVLHRDRRILYLLLLFSVTVFINEGIVLDNSIRLGSSLGHLNTDTVWLADILSVLNVSGAIFAVILGYSIMRNPTERKMRKLPAFLPIREYTAGRTAADYRPDKKLHWKKRDTVILVTITLLYSALTLSTLGSTKAPQTCWSSSGEDEEIIFDLQEEQEDIRILYFGQVSREDFTFSQSNDGLNWSEEYDAQMNQGQCWKWKYVTNWYFNSKGEREYYNTTEQTVHFSGRYIRLRACQVGLKLNELIFRDAEGNTIPAIILSRTGDVENSELWSDPANLLDEQDTLEKLPGFFGETQDGEAQPSWWNSTYFDEIYHARTGFEFTQGTVPYETSHPPLGKVFISWCISIFGMTPFGWRFAGAVAGILMLPGIYLLSKQLTKKTSIAAFSCGLLALDCMHLTQTQIATIDSFPVLFIIFAFFFMLRFFQTDLRKCTLKSSLIPLAFSGLFMGLSIASKWIGIYAGIGLAVLYFWHCIRQISLSREENRQDTSDTVRRVFFLSLWCMLFFVLIPLFLYLISYIPYMAYNTRIKNIGDYLNAVWRAQESMLSYHSTPGLGMDHPFYSPWWEWPIIGKPMFYASEQYVPKNAALHHSIFSFGNPVVWWGALAALPFAVFLWIRGKHYRISGFDERWHLNSISWDFRFEFVFISFLAQYLPWVLVPRGTYIYHYFASIPFLILMVSICLESTKPEQEKIYRMIRICIISAALILFIILLPYSVGFASGTGWLGLGKNLLHIWY